VPGSLGLLLSSGAVLHRSLLYSAVEQGTSISAGTKLRREVKKGQVDAVVATLRRTQFVTIIIEQFGVELEVTVMDPDGRVSAQMESPYSDFGDLPVLLITEYPGQYTIQVRAKGSLPAGGYCEINLQSRDVLPNDSHHVEAQKAYVAGRQVGRRSGPESALKAIQEYQRSLSL
jgi:hypothetical protein